MHIPGTAKNPYGDISVRRKLLTEKIPYSEISVRWKLRTEKFPYDKKSVRWKLRTAKILRRKFPWWQIVRRKFLAPPDTYILLNPSKPALKKKLSYESYLTENLLFISVIKYSKWDSFMLLPLRPSLFIVYDLYPIISTAQLDSSVSQDSVIIIKVNCFLIWFKLVIKSANLPVLFSTFTVRTNKLLCSKLLSSLRHSVYVRTLGGILVDLDF